MNRSRWLIVVGVVALAAGVTLAGEVTWRVGGTDLVADHAQQDESGALDQQWRDNIPTPIGAVPFGTPIARITIPRLGPDWTRVLLEGVDQPTLADGPGHYPGAGHLGQQGNYAIAGHRVGQGAPFDAAAELVPCDPITVTTRDHVYTYRVLPYGNQPAPCALPLVAGVPGQEIVAPTDTAVIASPPGGASTAAALLTITTCHPRFSACQRLIIHAVLVDETSRPASG